VPAKVKQRRTGRDWYLGAITNEQSRRAAVSLEFLDLRSDGKDTKWRAHRYNDGECASATSLAV
jgi:hypothetical protein